MRLLLLNISDIHVGTIDKQENEGLVLSKFIVDVEEQIRKLHYDDIYVIRNERVVKIVDSEGRVFEPDFLLYLRKKDDKQFVYQIFIEPKGAHLKGKDKWKEAFLKELRNQNMVIDIDTDKYHITGVPFYNKGDENEFKQELESMIMSME